MNSVSAAVCKARVRLRLNNIVCAEYVTQLVPTGMETQVKRRASVSGRSLMLRINAGVIELMKKLENHVTVTAESVPVSMC